MQSTLERIRAAAPQAPTGVLFEYVDDHARLSSHMSESSWMMGHGQMKNLGGFYARWCTRQMLRGVARHFSPTSPQAL